MCGSYPYVCSDSTKDERIWVYVIPEREECAYVLWQEDIKDIFIDRIKEEIKELSWFKPQIKALNGEWLLEFTIFANRRNPQSEEDFKLYYAIGEMAEGNYGLIYLYDDEADGKENQFQVFALSKGSVKEFSDSYLSPIIPTIEDME